MSDDTYRGWSAADIERDTADHAGTRDHHDDDEPFGRPANPTPPPLPTPPTTVLCRAEVAFHGSKRAPRLCMGTVVDGRCQRCRKENADV
jgi:hypothetical protein